MRHSACPKHVSGRLARAWRQLSRGGRVSKTCSVDLEPARFSPPAPPPPSSSDCSSSSALSLPPQIFLSPSSVCPSFLSEEKTNRPLSCE
eukprot:8555782-Pyramimonas_sp.AAC.1